MTAEGRERYSQECGSSHHVVVKVLGTHVDVGSKHLGPIVIGGAESRRKSLNRGGHVAELPAKKYKGEVGSTRSLFTLECRNKNW